MNSSDSSPCHQILVTGIPDPDPRYLLNSHANVKYEITRVDLRDADIHRNGELVATVRRGWFGRVVISMHRNEQFRAPKKAETSCRMDGRGSLEPAPRRVKWSGVDYFCAIHIKKDRVIATYDPRETTFELKGSLGLENESDTDIINELVASWVIHEYKARESMRGGLEPHIYPWTRFDDNYKKYGTPDSCTAVEKRGTPGHTFESPADQTATTGKQGVIIASEESLARNGVMADTTSEGHFGPRKMVAPWQDDYQLVRMKDAMTQTDPQPPDY